MFEPGNQMWKLRSKHGREKLFASPKLLWEAACEYFQWVDDNPFQRSEQMKGTIVIPKDFKGDLGDCKPVLNLDVKRPYTMQGLCLYLGAHTGYLKQFKADLKNMKDAEQALDFYTVITHIEETVYQQKFEGAASGFFNANIIARDLGLRDGMNVATPPGESIDVSIKIT